MNHKAVNPHLVALKHIIAFHMMLCFLYKSFSCLVTGLILIITSSCVFILHSLQTEGSPKHSVLQTALCGLSSFSLFCSGLYLAILCTSIETSGMVHAHKYVHIIHTITLYYLLSNREIRDPLKVR